MIMIMIINIDIVVSIYSYCFFLKGTAPATTSAASAMSALAVTMWLAWAVAASPSTDHCFRRGYRRRQSPTAVWDKKKGLDNMRRHVPSGRHRPLAVCRRHCSEMLARAKTKKTGPIARREVGELYECRSDVAAEIALAQSLATCDGKITVFEPSPLRLSALQ